MKVLIVNISDKNGIDKCPLFLNNLSRKNMFRLYLFPKKLCTNLLIALFELVYSPYKDIINE